MSKSNFIRDTKLIDEKISIPLTEVEGEMLQAAFLPYYVDPDSLKLTVVLKRSLLPGSYARTGRKMGLSAITVEVPEDVPLTVEQAYEKTNVKASIQNIIPFGSVMPRPQKSNMAYEMVLVQIEPVELIDVDRGLIYQEKGAFEIGIVTFDELLSAIQDNLIQDLITRMMLSELYILALEESNKMQNTNNMMVGNQNLIGGGSNLPEGFGDQSEHVKTSDIPDEIIAENSKMDFGSIYSKASSSNGFTTIEFK